MRPELDRPWASNRVDLNQSKDGLQGVGRVANQTPLDHPSQVTLGRQPTQWALEVRESAYNNPPLGHSLPLMCNYKGL